MRWRSGGIHTKPTPSTAEQLVSSKAVGPHNHYPNQSKNLNLPPTARWKLRLPTIVPAKGLSASAGRHKTRTIILWPFPVGNLLSKINCNGLKPHDFFCFLVLDYMFFFFFLSVDFTLLYKSAFKGFWYYLLGILPRHSLRPQLSARFVHMVVFVLRFKLQQRRWFQAFMLHRKRIWSLAGTGLLASKSGELQQKTLEWWL